MTDDLIARLRESDPNWTVPKLRNPDGPDAADALEALANLTAQLADALMDVNERGIPDRYISDKHLREKVDECLSCYRTAFPEPRHD